jgi:hypothetical protein
LQPELFQKKSIEKASVLAVATRLENQLPTNAKLSLAVNVHLQK